MSVTIKFANGETLSPHYALSTQVSYQNTMRSAIEFSFPEKDCTIEQLRALFTESNCETITLVQEGAEGETPITEYYDGYVLLARISLEERMVESDDEEQPHKFEKFYVVTVARRTYSEKQLSEVQACVDQALQLALGAI